MNTNTQLEKLISLLEIEKKEDLRQYREMVLRRTLKERVERGISWYPVSLKGVYIGTGEKFVLELERGGDGKTSNALQVGSTVRIFGMNADQEVGRNSGVISWIKRNQMMIVLSSEVYPEWLSRAKIGVDLDFDDTTYREMDKALHQVMEAGKQERISELKDIIIGNKKPSFHTWHVHYHNTELNPSQNRAVQRALEALDVAVIHGPPGTGKTTTLVQTIKETLSREHQVLVCAPSNTAVDLLTLKCEEQGLSVVRLGNPARIDERLHQLTMDGAISGHDDYKLLKKYRKDADDARKRANKFKRKFGARERHFRNQMMREARELTQMAHKLEDYIIHQILTQNQVIACTLVGASSSLLGNKRFHSVFIDEAAQALTPACWIPILRSGRVIFAGDHFQLPPTVKSPEASKEGLSVTLLEQVMKAKPDASVMLEQQYRMHEQIMRFSGKWFYKDKLTADLSVRYRTLGEGFEPLEFVDTAGLGYEEEKDPDTLSTYNSEEALLLLKHLALLLNSLESQGANIFDQGLKIGIIAPYKAQVRILRDTLRDSPMLSSYQEYISINTVDGFQGQECDIIYISLTRSNAQGEIGFLGDVRRMNVALTRAKMKLVVVGDSATLGRHPFYEAFIEYVEEVDAYHTAWEWASV